MDATSGCGRAQGAPSAAVPPGPPRWSTAASTSICRKCARLVGSCTTNPPARSLRWRRTLFEKLRTPGTPPAPPPDHGEFSKQTNAAGRPGRRGVTCYVQTDASRGLERENGGDLLRGRARHVETCVGTAEIMIKTCVGTAEIMIKTFRRAIAGCYSRDFVSEIREIFQPTLSECESG